MTQSQIPVKFTASVQLLAVISFESGRIFTLPPPPLVSSAPLILGTLIQYELRSRDNGIFDTQPSAAHV